MKHLFSILALASIIIFQTGCVSTSSSSSSNGQEPPKQSETLSEINSVFNVRKGSAEVTISLTAIKAQTAKEQIFNSFIQRGAITLQYSTGDFTVILPRDKAQHAYAWFVEEYTILDWDIKWLDTNTTPTNDDITFHIVIKPTFNLTDFSRLM